MINRIVEDGAKCPTCKLNHLTVYMNDVGERLSECSHCGHYVADVMPRVGNKLNVYVGHANSFNYVDELYKPVKGSSMYTENNVVLPHEESDKPFDSREFLKTCDVFIAEVSYAATGLGIELCWADMFGVPIVCVYKKGSKVSGSIGVLTESFVEYDSEEDMVRKIENVIAMYKKEGVENGKLKRASNENGENLQG
ncbi:hypothetical protein [Bacillus sp. NEAU-Y102]